MATIVSEPTKLTHIHIPKTGGTSIHNWLETHASGRRFVPIHAKLDSILDNENNNIKLTMDDLGLKFCVVRNPWDWIVSWYEFEQRKMREFIAKVDLQKALLNREDVKARYEADKAELARAAETGFEGYIANLKIELLKVPQHTWAKECDLVLRYETLAEDFKQIQDMIGVQEPLPVLNATEKDKGYKDYYTDETRDKVAELYQIDCETYNYVF